MQREQPDYWSKDRAQRICRAMKSNDLPAISSVHVLNQECVARRRANAFTQSIDDSAYEHHGPDRRKRDYYFPNSGSAIADEDQGASAYAVGDLSRKKFGQ
jgi:hypothetical protein